VGSSIREGVMGESRLWRVKRRELRSGEEEGEGEEEGGRGRAGLLLGLGL
jgi:hypothetical protein